MFSFRRKTREEITAETFDARFQVRATGKGALDRWLPDIFLAQAPQYARTEIAPYVNVYSADTGAKNLIVGFGSLSGRLNMPVHSILEALDSGAHDLLLLADPAKSHFDKGVAGYAGSLSALMTKVGDFARRRGYSSIIAYGTSMGGFPALRGGEMLGADRSISIGGRFPWHPLRLAERKREINAFDALCDCRRPFRSRIYLLYAQGQPKDDQHAAMLQAVEPGCRAIPIPVDDHNFPNLIRHNGKLSLFLAELFDLSREPAADRLAALFE